MQIPQNTTIINKSIYIMIFRYESFELDDLYITACSQFQIKK